VHATIPADDVAAGASGAQAPSTLSLDFSALATYLFSQSTPDMLGFMERNGMSISQIKTLCLLDMLADELTLKDVAGHLGLSLPAASRLVDSLLARGCLVRREDELDRRMKRVSITDTGRAVCVQMNAARLATIERFLATLDVDERAAFDDAISLLARRPEIQAWRARIERGASASRTTDRQEAN
jgi:DNA-binding MarR family transcriptional regulator